MKNWTFWDWVGYAALALGAIFLAVDGGLRNSPEIQKMGLPPFFSGVLWAFLPLIFVIAGTLILLARGLGWIGGGPTTLPNDTPSSDRSEAIRRAVQRPAAERIFVGPGVTPEYLADIYKAHTAIQANKLTETYAGKWMRVTGDVDQVKQIGKDGECYVTLRGMVYILLSFDRGWLDRVSILTLGEKASVVGQIGRIDASTLQLENCELDSARQIDV